MHHPVDRRTFLAGMLALAATHGVGAREATPPAIGTAFDRSTLETIARRLADAPYVAPAAPPSTGLPVDYDLYRAIVPVPDKALWASDDQQFRADFFHAGRSGSSSTRIFQVEEGVAREIPYDADRFDFFFGDKNPENFDLPAAYAGLRLHARMGEDGRFGEFAVFQGASYFRAISKGLFYGMSARGVAIDTGTGRPEEFPAFTEFWLEKPEPDDETITVHALMDGPSLTGAYTFVLSTTDETTIDVDCKLFMRRSVERLGIAPITGMYRSGSFDRGSFDDFRPRVHDAEGLVLRQGNGERIWRPLQNPSSPLVSTFSDLDPIRFGLVQRDRDFAGYLDLEARYDGRPSVLIEPLGKWGEGAIVLYEYPTETEAEDNVAAFWSPSEPTAPGQELSFAYRMRWGNVDESRDIGVVVGSHSGRGGNAAAIDGTGRRFVIDFVGGEIDAETDPLVEIDVEGSTLISSGQRANPLTGGLRVQFELDQTDGPLRVACSVRARNGRQLAETWSWSTT